MAMDPVKPQPLNADDSTVYTAITPPETIANDLDSLGNVESSTTSVPWRGSIFIIRSVSCQRVITLHYGQIMLAHPGMLGSIHWECVEIKGWFGFRNAASGKFLGHDDNGRLHCSAVQHQGWERFDIRHLPEGGYALLMTHGEDLWPVGIKTEQGLEVLARIKEGQSTGIAWEFVEVCKNASLN